MPLMQLPDHLERVVAALAAAGGRPLVVGGAVRDALRGEQPKDFDLEVYGLPAERVEEALALLGRVHRVGRSFGVFKLRIGADIQLDVSLPRRENKVGRGHRGFMVHPDPTMTPREAASRRDFTINAMAWDPRTGALLDDFGGQEDLRRRRLRHTGPRFVEDPLRVLRGVQFAGRFDLEPDPETVALSRRLRDEQETLAPERVWEEWRKWASRSMRPSRGLAFLRACDWWEQYPALVALAATPQDPRWHPEGDVWTHTLLVCDAAAGIARRDTLGPEDSAVLLLAALCHDLGKPATTHERDGRVRSPGHAELTGPMEQLLEQIGAPVRLIRRVIVLCRFHLTHLGFADSKRHVRRLARSLGEEGETIPMLARLIEADAGGRPPLPGGLPGEMARLLAVAREVEADAAAPRPLLRGRDLLEVGFAPGPALGDALRAAYEAQLDGRFESREAALEWVLGRCRPGDASQ